MLLKKLNLFSKFMLFNVFISYFYCIINNFEKYSFINSSFVIGMFYLIIGLLFFVGEKGFFNLTLYSFNKLYQQQQKRKGLLNDPEITIEEYVTKKYSFASTSSLLSSGFIISTIALMLSFVLYF